MLDRHRDALDKNMARMTFELRNQHDTTINLRSMRIRNESVAGINHLQSLRGGGAYCLNATMKLGEKNIQVSLIATRISNLIKLIIYSLFLFNTIVSPLLEYCLSYSLPLIL